jgi:hypothetical protein
LFRLRQSNTRCYIGLKDGAVGLLAGGLANVGIKAILPIMTGGGGSIIGFHYTTAEAAEQIEATGIVNPDGPGLGSLGGKVYAWPQPVPLWLNNVFGSGPGSNTIVIVRSDPSCTSQNGLGALTINGGADVVQVVRR